MSTQPVKPRRFATMERVAEDYDVAVVTIRAWIRQGKLRGYRLGGRAVRIDLDDFEKLLRPIPTTTARERRGGGA